MYATGVSVELADYPTEGRFDIYQALHCALARLNSNTPLEPSNLDRGTIFVAAASGKRFSDLVFALTMAGATFRCFHVAPGEIAGVISVPEIGTYEGAVDATGMPLVGFAAVQEALSVEPVQGLSARLRSLYGVDVAEAWDQAWATATDTGADSEGLAADVLQQQPENP